MDEEYTVDEEYTYAPDITMSELDTSILYPDGCKFKRSAIVCEEKKRKDGDCDRCGWNPRVARRRSYLIRKQMEEDDARNAV